MQIDYDDPCYAISVTARFIGVHVQTLRYYERAGLVRPQRSTGNTRLYSRRDIDRLIQIKQWIEDLGVNLAGVEVIERLNERVFELESQVQELIKELIVLRNKSNKSLNSGR